MKYIIYILALTGVLAGCSKKTDDIFDKTVDERLTETLTNLQSYLVNAPGWKLFVYPKGLESQNIFIGGFTYYVKFTSNNRVSMVSDFIVGQAVTPKESSYRITSFQRPSLVFDTYNYMHVAADPDQVVSLSPIQSNGGFGQGTDFNYSFKDITPKDTMYLEGNYNKSEAVLIKATQAEMDAAFTNARVRDIMNFSLPYPATNPLLYFPASPSLNVGVGFDFTNGFITFSYINAGALVNTSPGFSFTTYGVHLQKPVTIGNYTFQDLYWDDVKKLYYIQSGTTRVEFANSATPLIVQPLTDIIGKQYKKIIVPPIPATGTGLPSTSTLFLQKYKLAYDGMITGPYTLKMDNITFDFNAAAGTMVLTVDVYQGTAKFLLTYNYTYSVDPTGLFKFTKVSQNGNAGLVTAAMNNLLTYIDNDQFNIDGIATSFGFLAKFTSKQNPTFFFTGNLY